MQLDAHPAAALLLRDDEGGLEAEEQDRRGSYVPVGKTPGPNEAVVNVGYCFQRRTNDTLRSVGHRVRAPAGKTKGELLDSLCRNYRLLWKPRRDQCVGSPPEFVSPAQPAKYGAMSAWK